MLCLLMAPWPLAAQQVETSREFEYGPAREQLGTLDPAAAAKVSVSPSCLATAPDYGLFLIDTANSRILVLDDRFATRAVWSIPAAAGQRRSLPVDIARMADGRLLVSDAEAACLRVLGQDGRVEPPMEGHPELGASYFEAIERVWVDPRGDILAYDPKAERLVKMTADGRLLHYWQGTQLRRCLVTKDGLEWLESVGGLGFCLMQSYELSGYTTMARILTTLGTRRGHFSVLEADLAGLDPDGRMCVRLVLGNDGLPTAEEVLLLGYARREERVAWLELGRETRFPSRPSAAGRDGRIHRLVVDSRGARLLTFEPGRGGQQEH